MANYYIKLYVSKTTIKVLSLNVMDWVIGYDLGHIFIEYDNASLTLQRRAPHLVRSHLQHTRVLKRPFEARVDLCE